jgi:hypothetical protein
VRLSALRVIAGLPCRGLRSPSFQFLYLPYSFSRLVLFWLLTVTGHMKKVCKISYNTLKDRLRVGRAGNDTACGTFGIQDLRHLAARDGNGASRRYAARQHLFGYGILNGPLYHPP